MVKICGTPKLLVLHSGLSIMNLSPLGPKWSNHQIHTFPTQEQRQRLSEGLLWGEEDWVTGSPWLDGLEVKGKHPAT